MFWSFGYLHMYSNTHTHTIDHITAHNNNSLFGLAHSQIYRLFNIMWYFQIVLITIKNVNIIDWNVDEKKSFQIRLVKYKI